MKINYPVLFVGTIFFFISCDKILEVTDISAEQVVLIAPSDSAVVARNDVSLHWQELPGADRYKVQVALPDFENASQVILDTLIIVDSTYLGTRLSGTLGDNPYEWRVKAMNSDYGTTYTTNRFIVKTSEK